ncbi:MAG: hypothetical protein AB1458_12090 [Bacteroidota bacterium]
MTQLVPEKDKTGQIRTNHPNGPEPLSELYTMNTQVRLSDTWNAFVFGAVFNVLAAKPDETLVYYTIKTLIGGVIWLTFQILADKYRARRASEEKKAERRNEQEPGRP